MSGSSTVEPISIAAATASPRPPRRRRSRSRALARATASPASAPARPTSPTPPVRSATRRSQACADAGIEFIELKVAIDGLSVITSAENTAVECLVVRRPLRAARPRRRRDHQLGRCLGRSRRDRRHGHRSRRRAHAVPRPAELTVTAPGEESGTFDSFVELAIADVGEALGVEEVAARLDYTASPNDNVIIEGISANPSRSAGSASRSSRRTSTSSRRSRSTAAPAASSRRRRRSPAASTRSPVTSTST